METLLRLIFGGVILFHSSAMAQNTGSRKPWQSPVAMGEYKEKAEKKASSRWTLKDWLEQKERNQMMDLWLGMYAPSPYEVFFSVSQQAYDTETNNPAARIGHKSLQGSAAFFALVLGLEANYENNIEESFQDATGLLHLRIVGNANQGTHINLFYGLRKHTESGSIEILQQVAGTDIDLYIEKKIGLHFNYKHFLPNKEGSPLGEVTGQRTEGGAFFDVGFVRMFGNYYQESFNNLVEPNPRIDRNRTGYHYGLKFFF